MKKYFKDKYVLYSDCVSECSKICDSYNIKIQMIIDQNERLENLLSRAEYQKTLMVNKDLEKSQSDLEEKNKVIDQLEEENYILKESAEISLCCDKPLNQLIQENIYFKNRIVDLEEANTNLNNKEKELCDKIKHLEAPIFSVGDQVRFKDDYPHNPEDNKFIILDIFKGEFLTLCKKI